MIHRDTVIGLMVAAYPAYRSSEQAARVDDDDGPYIQMASLVTYLLETLGRGDAEPLDRVAEVAELVLAEGDGDAKTLIAVGFVEDLTNRNLWPEGLSPAELRAHLGPLSLQTRWGWQLRLDAEG
jgi:hypothetical protein